MFSCKAIYWLPAGSGVYSKLLYHGFPLCGPCPVPYHLSFILFINYSKYHPQIPSNMSVSRALLHTYGAHTKQIATVKYGQSYGPGYGHPEV